MLLDALARLRAPFELHVVGEGSERHALEQRAAALGLGERALFHGFVSREELVRQYAGCDIFVLPSLGGVQGDVEGLGVPAIEALAFGKPVIATAVGGIGESVIDGTTGVLVPPDDARAIAAAIEGLAGDAERRARLGGDGRAHVERTFSWSAIVRGIAEAYEDARARYSAKAGAR